MATSTRDNARGQAGEVGKANTTDNEILAEVFDAIKARVMTGASICANDFEPEQRAFFWAAIAKIRDELPNLRPSWRTIREEHVDGLRLRERIFRLRGGA